MEKHDNLSLMALTWLSNKITKKGLRGTTEVALDEGYVADAVALCSFQYRFWQLYSRTRAAQTIRDYKQHQINSKQKDMANYFACIFEAKANRNDFLSTFNKKEKHLNRHQPIGNLHWCVANKGVAKENELPDFWGLLVPCGGGLTEIKRPVIKALEKPALDKIAHSLLWAIQSRRNYIVCKNCGRYIYTGYCNRCFLLKGGD